VLLDMRSLSLLPCVIFVISLCPCFLPLGCTSTALLHCSLTLEPCYYYWFRGPRPCTVIDVHLHMYSAPRAALVTPNSQDFTIGVEYEPGVLIGKGKHLWELCVAAETAGAGTGSD
jgi:hypothetical protein